jgi:hydroxymethylbilane synthase
LPVESRIGTSSQRRKEQIRELRPDLELVDIRGNIQERLALIDTGRINALIVAHAALLRLGLESRISEILPLAAFTTHPKQGRLSVVAREDTWKKLKSLL